jgi:hypothetical protein
MRGVSARKAFFEFAASSPRQTSVAAAAASHAMRQPQIPHMMLTTQSLFARDAVAPDAAA